MRLRDFAPLLGLGLLLLPGVRPASALELATPYGRTEGCYAGDPDCRIGGAYGSVRPSFLPDGTPVRLCSPRALAIGHCRVSDLPAGSLSGGLAPDGDGPPDASPAGLAGPAYGPDPDDEAAPPVYRRPVAYAPGYAPQDRPGYYGPGRRVYPAPYRPAYQPRYGQPAPRYLLGGDQRPPGYAPPPQGRARYLAYGPGAPPPPAVRTPRRVPGDRCNGPHGIPGLSC